MSELKLPIIMIDRLRMITDGGGVTTLICSSGCPLRCRFCVNPSSWDGTPPIESLTIDELYERVKIDNLYFLSTNGGLCFGGGEPLLHSKFLKSFMNKYKKLGWNFYIESSLSVSKENIEDILPFANSYIIDTKDMNKERYEKYTNGNYDLFFENLLFLKENVPVEKIKVRVPEIEFLHNGNKEQLENVDKLKELGFTDIELLKYIDPESRKKISEAAKENKNILSNGKTW